MFCLAMRRDAFERIGPLDQRFEVGHARGRRLLDARAREAGYRLVCAEDAFVHHFGETSFGKLVSDRRATARSWRRTSAASRRSGASRGSRTSAGPTPTTSGSRERIREIVADTLPAEATVLVVSKGDEELLQLGGRRARHFPEAADDGSWAGHHPADSERGGRRARGDARSRGRVHRVPAHGHVVAASTTEGCTEHLEQRYDAVVRDEDVCVIFALNGRDRVTRPALHDRDPGARPGGAHAPAASTRSWPTRRRTPFEIVVVDDASTDETPRLLARQPATGCAPCAATTTAASRSPATTARRRRAASCSSS